jgi:hypothetical protein
MKLPVNQSGPTEIPRPAAVAFPPREKRPLGRLFYILLCTPAAIAAASVAMTALRSVDRNLPMLGLISFLLNLPIMPICAIICAVIAGKRRTTDFGMLTFVGVMVFHVVVVVLMLVFVGLREPTHM